MQSFNIHIYNEPTQGLCILHAQVNETTNAAHTKESNHEENQPMIDMPPFLHVERQINSSKEDNEKYGAFNLSRIQN